MSGSKNASADDNMDTSEAKEGINISPNSTNVPTSVTNESSSSRHTSIHTPVPPVPPNRRRKFSQISSPVSPASDDILVPYRIPLLVSLALY